MKLLKFYTDTCSQCKQQSRILNEVNPKPEIAEVDCEESPEMVSKYAIRGLPTLIILDDNDKEIQRFIGVTPASVLSKIFEN